MIASNFTGIVAVAFAIFVTIETGANAFVPVDARVKVGGGQSILFGPPESLSFAALHYQKLPKETDSPRMSQKDFRLDYVQGVRPPQKKILAKVKEDAKKTKDDFVYGRDSTCYRGLTKPSRAGLVLALVLASSLVVASPDIHLPSIDSFLDSARYLMGDDAASELSALIERLVFQWDMSGVENYLHDVSDQASSVFRNELLPLSSQLRDNFQEAATTVSGQFDAFLSQIASRIDSMKHELAHTVASPKATIHQVLVRGQEALSQRSNEWQLASRGAIEHVNQHVAQAGSNLQAGIAQVWDKLAHTKEAIVSKSLEYEQAGMDSIHARVHHTNEELRGLANRYDETVKHFSVPEYSAFNMDDLQQRAQTEAFKYREMAESFIGPKFSKLQELSQAKLTELGQNRIQQTENIHRILNEVGTEFETKGRDATRHVVPFVEDSDRILQQRMFAFRDSSVDAIHNVKEQAFQGRAAMDTVQETLREWKDSVANALPNAKVSIPGQLATQYTLPNLKDGAKSITEQVSTSAESLANQVSIQETIQDLKDSATAITSQVSIQNSLDDLKDGASSLANQVAIQDRLEELKDSANSIIGQVSIENSIHDLKDSTKSIANQLSIQDTLQDLKDTTRSIPNQAILQDTLQDLKDSTTNALSNAGNTVTNHVGNISPHHNPLPTESSYLKMVLNDVVY